MGHFRIEIENTKLLNNTYGKEKSSYRHINSEIEKRKEKKTFKNNKNDEKYLKIMSENIKNKVKKNN